MGIPAEEPGAIDLAHRISRVAHCWADREPGEGCRPSSVAGGPGPYDMEMQTGDLCSALDVQLLKRSGFIVVVPTLKTPEDKDKAFTAGMWVVCIPGWAAAAATAALLLYGTLDVAYFARMFYTVARARYARKKVCIMDTTEIKSMCLLSDIDTLLYHMNNARYLRELDFARADFYERTGLYSGIRVAGGAVVQAAATIRYRRFLRPFTSYTITSKAVYWDEKTVFMEHRFIGANGFVHAIAVCRQRVLDTSANAAIERLLRAHCGGSCGEPATKIPAELDLWVQSNEISSAKLRPSSPEVVPALSEKLLDGGEGVKVSN
ncbi:Protein THEM6 [Eumeta japonica]|uniref:Protein THEM6 n=1 Tax=Eumeta variegata TaxID=151549 RepID=A0A4C1ZEJ3_EUMVA|nr:Protein THEM6 [Eumeta japonica]